MATEVSLRHHRNYIGGEWVDAVGGETMAVLNPATGDPVAEVPASTQLDVDNAVASAERALERWLDATPRERGDLLLALAERLAAHADELGAIESAEVGKPLGDAVEDLGLAVDDLRFFAGASRNLEGRASYEYRRGMTSQIRREPIGVVAGICPWNYPLNMAVWKLGPALAAGNAEILKPSEEAPSSLLRFLELAGDVIPPGVLQAVSGRGEEAGESLVRHPRIGLISLTGGTETGRRIATLAAGSLKRVHLELGGKAPMIVCDDADAAAAAKGVRIAGFSNSGQDCTAASRILVGARVYDAFVEELLTAVGSIVVGDPTDGDDVEMGPVISDVHRDRVLGFVERAQSATVLAGGAAPARPGYFVQPTVLADVQQSDEIVQDEVFGPVVTVQRFTTPEEAISLANDVRYGLAASVWTHNLDLAVMASRKLRFGTVWINGHLIGHAPEMPHGGFAQSGYGTDLSAYAVEEYSQLKHVATWVRQWPTA